MNARDKLPVETPREWIRLAEENLRVATREMQYETPAYHTVCFLCQSAAEKYLKAYLISQGWPLKKTHDIVELVEFCSDYSADFDELLPESGVLNDYITAGRYPGDLAFELIGEKEAREAVEVADKIRATVMALMGRL